MFKSLQLAFAIVSFLCVHTAFAQNAKVKFGKVSKEELQSTVCPIDSNASAYFVYDKAYSYFQYASAKVNVSQGAQNGKGFQLYFKRQFRIKILKNDALHYGNVEIPVYHSDTKKDKEEVLGVKAFTYNLENGKVVKSKVSRSEMMTEESSKNWDVMKIALSDVKEGSVIEVEYMIRSDFLFNLRDWYFQKSIPNLYSEYIVAIPEYFKYNQFMSGCFHVDLKQEQRLDEVTITFVEDVELGQTRSYKNTIAYTNQQYIYTAHDIPTFPKEKFLRTEDNYLSKVEFELEYTRYPNSATNYYTTSWEQIDRELLESYRFGKELNRKGHLKDAVAALQAMNYDKNELLQAAFNHIKNKIAWNRINSKYVEKSLPNAYKNGEGNVADINLNLVVLLRELGFNTLPVVLSTQANGIIHPVHPSISRFNYVVAMVHMDGVNYLLDATDPLSDINLLPERCLNDKGRIIGDFSDEWINLMDYKKFVNRSIYKLTLTDELALEGEVNKMYSEYGAYHKRRAIKKENNIDEYVASLNNNKSSESYADFEVSDLDSISKGLKVSYSMVKEHAVDASGEMVYFSPAINPFFQENPFKLETREFPVEFDYPYQIQEIYSVQLPENYEVVELPKPLVIRLSDNSASYIYQISNNNGALMASIRLIINKSLYLPNNYDELKMFFQKMVDKQKEMVVLKAKG